MVFRRTVLFAGLLLCSLAHAQNAPSTSTPVYEGTSPSTWGRSWDDPANLRHGADIWGAPGLLHLASPDLGPSGLFRMSLEGEYYKATHSPLLGNGGRRSGMMGISFVPVEALALYGAFNFFSTTSSLASPSVIRVVGDAAGGLRVGTELAHGFWLGADVRFQYFYRGQTPDMARPSVGITPSLLMLYDFRQPDSTIPLRLTANAGVAIDKVTPTAGQRPLAISEEYALGTSAFNRAVVTVGLEVPLPVVTPFVQYGVQVPLGVKPGTLVTSSGTPIAVVDAMPSRVSGGLEITAIPNLTLFAAADIGLNRRYAVGLPGVLPFNLLFGASLAADFFEHDRFRKAQADRDAAAPKLARAAGVVLDAQTRKPLGGAVIQVVGSDLPPVASDVSTGKFLTRELSVGKTKLSVQKEGYRETTQEVALQSGKTTQVELTLESVAPRARFTVRVTSNKAPVAATAVFKGTQELKVETTASGDPASLEVPPGMYEVTVQAPGYQSQTRQVEISENATLRLSFELLPEKQLVTVTDTKIELSQTIHFATGKAIILADSFALLKGVADAIVKHNIKKIRVEGHTDNQGGKRTNLKLSEARARAVGKYLMGAGIEASRIETVGLGDTRPVAPNNTAEGRELNRRVEFLIVDR